MAALRFAGCAALVAILSACASYYQVPSGVPMARLVFVTQLRPVVVKRFEDRTCAPSKQGVQMAYLDPLSNPAAQAVPIIVEAGRELVFTTELSVLASAASAGALTRAVGRNECVATTRFVPEAGETYEVHFLPGQRGCRTYVIHSIEQEGGERSLVPEPTAVTNERRCLGR